jgi:membrane protein DedA with SNARE-associated domain
MSIEHLVSDYMHRAEPWIASYGLYAVGLGILGETLLFAGVFIPGFSILVAAGLLAARGDLNPWATILVAILGGIVGDQTAYTLGRLMGDRLLGRHVRAQQRLSYALTHEGGFILLWYHYVSPMRIVMPYLAGSLRYPRGRWLLFDSIGLTLWVFFGFGLGYVAMGPLKRFGDAGYYVIFAAIFGMMLFTIWRLARLLLRKESPADLFAQEVEQAGRAMKKSPQAEERIEQPAVTNPPQ